MDILTSNIARQLYDYAKGLPIIDYHNHLSLSDIESNVKIDNIYDLWIAPDPYKHRVMRMCGVPENLITGDAQKEDKFSAWCEAYEKSVGSPLYIWSKAELDVLGVKLEISKQNAKAIYEECNAYLQNHKLSTEEWMRRFNVEYSCPCASLVDNISVFAENDILSPSLRGDDAVNPTLKYVKKLSEITGTDIKSLDDYKKAICKRLDDFEACGCIFSDHALDDGFMFFADDGKNAERFSAVLSGESADEKLKSYILTFMGSEYAKRKMVMQLHVGAKRFTSTRLRTLAGSAGGFAGIGNSISAKALCELLDTLEQKNGLPKTVIFPLNPSDNALVSVLSGSFSKDGVSGLISEGPAWWWCDHRYGIENMLENTASFGLLYNFIGMTTDSRSILSFVRHDYFRAVLCEFMAKKAQCGDYPDNIELLKKYVYKLCYGNAEDVITERK